MPSTCKGNKVFCFGGCEVLLLTSPHTKPGNSDGEGLYRFEKHTNEFYFAKNVVICIFLHPQGIYSEINWKFWLSYAPNF